jgi:hypothetical protein
MIDAIEIIRPWLRIVQESNGILNISAPLLEGAPSCREKSTG